jgi:hypothetical protein
LAGADLRVSCHGCMQPCTMSPTCAWPLCHISTLPCMSLYVYSVRSQIIHDRFVPTPAGPMAPGFTTPPVSPAAVNLMGGARFWNALFGMHFLECTFWNAFLGMHFLECTFWNALLAVVWYRVPCHSAHWASFQHCWLLCVALFGCTFIKSPASSAEA